MRLARHQFGVAPLEGPSSGRATGEEDEREASQLRYLGWLQIRIGYTLDAESFLLEMRKRELVSIKMVEYLSLYSNLVISLFPN